MTEDTKMPWATEPDRAEFNYRGYDCLIRRNPGLKTLCGYVAIPKNSKFYNVDYTDEICDDLEVWGGLTFAGYFADSAKFYLGFDCAHSGDLVPSMLKLRQAIYPDKSVAELSGSDTYKDMTFVKNELHKLVDQIIDQS